VSSGGVLVIGGGITGLAAARELARDGVGVTLAEADTRVGGKVVTERVGGFTIEAGPDSFLATRPAGLALAHGLGLDDELIGTRAPRAVFIRHRGALVPMPDGMGLALPTRATPFLGTRLFSWPEKLRMAKDLVWPRILEPDDTAVGSYLRRRLGSPLVDRLAAPLVGGVYGTPIDEVSLDAVVPSLRVAERAHRSLLLAGLADGRRLRAAATAGPGRGQGLGAFVSLRGGMGALVDALETSLRDADVRVRNGLGVRALSRAGAGVAARFADGSLERFGAAVVAVPAPRAAALVDEEAPAAAGALGAIPHGTSIVVTLAYRREDVLHDLVGHGYLVPVVEGGAISACTWSSEKWPGRAPDGTVLLRLFVRDVRDLTSLSDDRLVAVARAEAETTLRIAGKPVLVRVARWSGSMPRYTVDHLVRVDAIEAAMAAWPSVVLAGSSYRGIGLPDCIAQGHAAARRTLERLGGERAAHAGAVASG